MTKAERRKAKAEARAKAKAEAKAGNGSKSEQELAATLGVQPETSEPEPKEPEAEATEEATPPTAEQDTTLAEMEKIAEQIKDPAQREKLLENIRKWHTESTRSSQIKAWKAFDDDIKSRLPDIFTELAKKHGVELTNRQIRITFPNGEFSHTNSVVGKGRGGGNGSRSMPSRWTGEAKNGEQVHDSPNALALALGLKVTGCRDMVDVFESQGYKVTELPACERANITIAKSDKERAERLKGLVKEGGNFVITKS